MEYPSGKRFKVKEASVSAKMKLIKTKTTTKCQKEQMNNTATNLQIRGALQRTLKNQTPQPHSPFFQPMRKQFVTKQTTETIYKNDFLLLLISQPNYNNSFLQSYYTSIELSYVLFSSKSKGVLSCVIQG